MFILSRSKTSGSSAKIKRSVFLHRAEFPEYMQKTAALYFCTPDPALFLHSGFMKLFDLLILYKNRNLLP